MSKLLVRGGRVVDPSQGLDAIADVLIEDGEVTRVGGEIRPGRYAEVVDAKGLIVAPGLIDMHVHLREPGQEYKETIESGTRAAAAGGFTAVAPMPNTVPPNDNRPITEHMLREAARHGYARVWPIGAVSVGQKGEQLAEIGDMVDAGIVAVTDDGMPVADAELMRRTLEYSQHYDIAVIQHAQDMNLSAGGMMHEGQWSTKLGLPGWPAIAEDVVVARDLTLLAETGGRYHVAHLSTEGSLELVRQAKARGLAATCEVTPHHLMLTDAAVAETGFSTNTKMNPPLRSETHRQALLAGLVDGTVDVIASDHAPHHADEKDVEFSLAPFGIVGLESTLALCLDRLVKPGVIDLSRLVELLSTAPARILNVPGGSLAPGSPGDVTLFSLKKRIRINADRFHSKSSNSPFHGWNLTGRAVGTIVGGRVVDPAG